MFEHTQFASSCVQYLVLKMSPYPLYLFKLYQKRDPYILHMLCRSLFTDIKLNFYFVWEFASA